MVHGCPWAYGPSYMARRKRHLANLDFNVFQESYTKINKFASVRVQICDLVSGGSTVCMSKQIGAFLSHPSRRVTSPPYPTLVALAPFLQSSWSTGDDCNDTIKILVGFGTT